MDGITLESDEQMNQDTMTSSKCHTIAYKCNRIAI